MPDPLGRFRATEGLLGSFRNYRLERSYSAIGEGSLPTDALVDVTGHSLGGHLAAVLSWLRPDKVSEVLTINGAGFSSIGRSNGNVDYFFQALGGYTNFGAGNIVNLYGNKGPNFVTQNAFLGLTQPGYTLPLFIENNSLGNKWGHSAGQMAHSAAVYEMYRKLEGESAPSEPGKMLARYQRLLEAAINDDNASFERSVDALRKLILGKTETPTAIGDLATFFSRLHELLDNPNFKNLQGKVLVTRSNPTLATLAKDDFGALISLLALSPIAITANGDANRTTIETLLGKGDFSTALSQWRTDKELSPEAKAAGQATFSDRWLQDRAEMMVQLGKAYEKDVPTISGFMNLTSLDGSTAQYIDLASNTKLNLVSRVWNHKQISFGNDANNTFEGAAQGDGLYGGKGDDVLKGLAGNDHLEGNEGADNLDGGADSDTLLGGAGVDTLTGGAGRDLLQGGDALDVYKFETGSGHDRIIDADGKGRIEVNGSVLDGKDTEKLPDKAWQSKDKKIKYAEVSLDSSSSFSSGLLITFADRPNDSILIEGWSETKNVGLEFGPAAAPPPAVHTTGDYEKSTGSGGITYSMDPSGNYIAAGPQPGAEDRIMGTSGSDVLLGLLGNDALMGQSGNDLIDGDEGSDYLIGGGGSDTIQGGAGRDFIDGSRLGSMLVGFMNTSAYAPEYFEKEQARTGGTIPSDAVSLADGFGWAVWSQPGGGVQLGLSVGSDVGREPSDQGNVISAGGDDDWVAAGTGADVVHGDDHLLRGGQGAGINRKCTTSVLQQHPQSW